MSDRAHAEIADRLEREKQEVDQLAFALALLVQDKGRIEEMAHRINSWIDDACEALRNNGQEADKR